MTEQPHPTVQGRCPACGGGGLFLGSGGYVTCPRIDCPEPDAASTLLEQSRGTMSITIEPVVLDLTVTKLAHWAPACDGGRHYPPHPGDTCDEADALITARDQWLVDFLCSLWNGVTADFLHGNDTETALGLLPTTGSPPAEPTPERRALDILRPHLATEPLYTEA